MGKLVYYISAVLFGIIAVMQLVNDDPIFWLLVFGFASLSSVLAARNKLGYLTILVGFLGYLMLLTLNFPEPGEFSLAYKSGRQAIGLIVCGNYIAILGIVKLYRESYL